MYNLSLLPLKYRVEGGFNKAFKDLRSFNFKFMNLMKMFMSNYLVLVLVLVLVW